MKKVSFIVEDQIEKDIVVVEQGYYPKRPKFYCYDKNKKIKSLGAEVKCGFVDELKKGNDL
jgi:hypothetical protein